MGTLRAADPDHPIGVDVTRRVQKTLLGVVFFLSPLAFFTRAAEGFTLTKELLAAASLTFILASFPVRDLRQAIRHGLVRTTMMFVLWMFLISLLTAEVKTEVFRGFIHYILFGEVILAMALLRVEGDDAFARYVRYSLYAAFLMSLYGLLQGAGIDRSLHWTTRFDGRVFSTLGNPNYLGGHLAALLPMAFLLMLGARQRSARLGWAITVGVLLLALLWTRARGSYLAFGVSFALMGVLFITPWGKPLAERHKSLLLCSYGSAFLLTLLMIVRIGGIAIFSPKGDTFRQRIDTWKTTLRIIEKHPILGVGVDQLKILYPAYQYRPFRPDQYREHPYTYTEHVHNEFMRFQLEGGIIGLLLFLGILVYFVRGLILRFNHPSISIEERALLLGSAGGVAAVLIQSLSNFPLQIAPTTIVFSMFLASSLEMSPGAPPASRSRFWMPFIGAGLVLLVGFRIVAVSVAYRHLLGETQLGNGRASVGYGQRLLSLDPWYYKGYFTYGKALESTQLYAAAVDAYRKAWQINPYHVESISAEAAIDMQQGRSQESLQLAEYAAGIAPNYAEPQFIRGAMLFEAGRYRDAAEAFRAVLVMIPQHFESWLNLGTCLIRMGDKEGAIAAWREADRIHPGDEMVKKYLRANGA